MFKDLIQPKKYPDSISASDTSQGFVDECLRVLNSSTAGTAIYILSFLCPDDFHVILELVSFDLSQPHRHPSLSKRWAHVGRNSSTNAISCLQKHLHNLPAKEHNRWWLEVTQRWLLTCPLDEGFYKPNETDQDLFCQTLRSELIDSILNIT